MAGWFRIKLWKRVFLGLVLGVLFGVLVSRAMDAGAAEALLANVRVAGDLFIALIRLVIVPLIFLTLVAGVVALGDPARLGTIGVKTIALYLGTTVIANIIGLGMGTLFRPGRGVDLGGAAPRAVSTESAGLIDRLAAMATKNPFEGLMAGDALTLALTAILLAAGGVAAWLSLRAGERRTLSAFTFAALFALGVAGASADILVVIGVSLVFGVVLLFTRSDAAASFFSYASDKVLVVTHWIMELAPFGVFALIAYVAGVKGLETFTAVASLAAAVYLGCILHMGLIYGGIIRFVLGLPFINFFRGILDAMMVAFSTSSSSATLPVTIASVSGNLGVSKSIAGSVLPLGATINMDGTALYLGIVALFTAQAFGYPIEPHHYPLIALTAGLVSIGAAGIPSASLFLLATVLDVFGVSAEHTALVVGFIFPFDRPLDMMRTVVNVTGDATVATTVAKWEGELDEAVFRARPAN
ncbi:MAG TPA: dicarboxylate/amino acid:cation symporter [Parvularcula sp.]|nr:dicarboxylate/amino acid:cation symporter [Parvularcula sp.]